MPVNIRQVGPCFAGEVEGIDMTQPLSPEDAAAHLILVRQGFPPLVRAIQ